MSGRPDELAGLEPFGILDIEAERLARFFAGLDGSAWDHCSEFATHADDVGAPVGAREEPGRTGWRAKVGRFTLRKRRSPVRVEAADGGLSVKLGEVNAVLSAADFVTATVDRLRPVSSSIPSCAGRLCVSPDPSRVWWSRRCG